MQLIFETETVLDIEKNMSAIEDIQNNIVENLDIEDINNKKCNGSNKVKELNDANEEDKLISKAIEETLVNIPTDNGNNEAELSNVDLSKVISKVDNAQTNESQDSGKVQNGIDTEQKEIFNEPEEEDYMEDDIISIREEPFEIDSEPVTENVDTNLDETTNEDMKRKSPNLNEVNISIGKEKDVIEVIDESQDSNDHSEKFTESNQKEEKDDIQIIEESQDSVDHCEKQIETLPQKENNDIEAIKESKDSVQCEKGSEPADGDAKNEMKVIEEEREESVNEIETKTNLPEESNGTDVSKETETLVPPENGNNSSIDDLQNDDINPIDSDKTGSNQVIKDTSIEENLEKLMGEVDKDEKTTSNEGEPIIIQNENNEDLSMKEDKEDTEVREESNSEVKDEVEVIEKTDRPSVNCENESSTDVASDKREPTNKISDTEVKVAVTENSAQNDDAMEAEEIPEGNKITSEAVVCPIDLGDDMDVEEVIEKNKNTEPAVSEVKTPSQLSNAAAASALVNNKTIDAPVICKLSNTLDIFSDDDEEEPPKEEPPKAPTPEVETPKVDAPKSPDNNEKQCINIEDDDDIMLIDEDTNKPEEKVPVDTKNKEEIPTTKSDDATDSETGEKTQQETSQPEVNVLKEKTPPPVSEIKETNIDIDIKEKTPEVNIDKPATPTPLVPDNFLKTAKKKLSEMSRDEIEEFCILKIVESIVDRSSLSDIKNKLKAMTQGLEEYRKKAMMLTKQNRDLQVVLKSVQEEQKKATGDTPITPLKITRSVGMQVFMEKTVPARKKGQQPNVNNKPVNNQQNRNNVPQVSRAQKPANQQIPVPRLVPANNPTLKTPSSVPQINPMNTPIKNSNPPNGIVKNPSPAMKAEKRQHSKMASSSVTVDLTDDEPPAKMPGGPKTSPAPPVRLVPPQNLMAPQRQPFGPGMNSPRKVYIPISGPQNQGLRPGQTIMLKTVPASGMRPTRCPTPQVTRVEPNAVRINRMAARHPAPLPTGMKQYQPPNWKGLPPAPDLKLSKVENGIVISWKIEGVPEDTYEEIASYQLYAYQETSTPPSTALWKKIGDVKALPLPMACTLTQFMAGFKYYFAVRAVDVRSRLGPFSLPGSILLLSKNI